MWSVERTRQFIADLHAAPCLWDRDLLDYKDTDMKNHALRIIAENYKMEVSEVKAKIHGLKTQFRREYKSLIKSGHDPLSPKKCSWFGYELMLFLINKDLTPNTSVNVDNINEHQLPPLPPLLPSPVEDVSKLISIRYVNVVKHSATYKRLHIFFNGGNCI